MINLHMNKFYCLEFVESAAAERAFCFKNSFFIILIFSLSSLMIRLLLAVCVNATTADRYITKLPKPFSDG